MKKSIVDYLEQTSKIYNEKTIFEEKDSKISYFDFCNDSKIIATNILENDIYNKPIAIFIDKSIDCLKAMFGILYSGNCYCVLDVTSPIERLSTIIDTLQPSLIISNNKNIDTLEIFDIKKVNIDQLSIKSINNKKLEIVNSKRIDTDPAYILFTSGSTGVPKGTVINHRSLINYTKWFGTTFNINNETIFGNQTPFYFSMSVSDVYSTIMFGATLNIIPKINFSFPMNLMKYLDSYKINTIYWVPSALSIVANSKVFDYIVPKYLKKVLFAGEVMPMPQLNIWRKYLPNIIYANLYGPTETTDICAYYVVNREFKDNQTLPIGNSCDNLEVLIITENNKQADKDEVGEIYVRGSFVGNGYYNNYEKTNLAFVQNPLNNNYPEIVYKTGDLGRINKYGEIEYFGRKDFQIKHMGYRIELGEIETNINSLEGLTICACIYDNIDKLIVLFYESQSLCDDDVIKFLNKKLAKYMQPNKVIKLPKMFYNANGKIDRVKLKQIYEEMK